MFLYLSLDLVCIKGAARPNGHVNEVWELDIDNGVEWIAATPMRLTRSSMTCNLITTTGGDDEIVVAGGLGGWWQARTVEIFSVNAGTWRDGELYQNAITQCDLIPPFQCPINTNKYMFVFRRRSS